MKLPKIDKDLLKKGPELKLPNLKALRQKGPSLKVPRPKLSRPKGAKLKAPRLKGPKLKTPSVKTPSVKAPAFLTDVYADLRDRRLLPFVALLLVAIVAAPFLLSSKGGDESEAPVAAVPVVAGASQSPASFSVVPANPGLRDFHRRLDREPRNPFKGPAGSAQKSSGGGEGGSEGDSGGAPAPEESSGGGEPSSQTTNNDVVVQAKVIGYGINAKLGFIDHLSEREGIQPGTKLPSEKNPVVVFVGLDKHKKRALFLMTSNVTAYYGKGHCAYDKASCPMLELAPGKSATFAYGYGEARFKLQLKKIVPLIEGKIEARRETVVHGRAQSGTNGGLEAVE